MSEGAPYANNPVIGKRKVLSVGLPPPETSVEVVDLETGTRVMPPYERGEIRVRGPQMISSYRNRPEETAHTIATAGSIPAISVTSTMRDTCSSSTEERTDYLRRLQHLPARG
jgi:acyl-CoA synthetase (AMP-forming)/AMP-acid ligase II